MTRSKTSLALLSVLALGACNKELTPFSNPSLTSVNQPIVQRTDYVLDLSSTGAGLPITEAGRLSGWFESLGLGYGDRIFVDEPQGYGDPQGRQDVAGVAGKYGLLLSDGAPVTAGTVQPGTVRVIVSRSAAEVPGCPLWDGVAIGDRITASPNYGCATNSNFAAMVADPNDLVLGQAGNGSGDAATAVKAIRVYRDAEPTGKGGIKETSTTEGSN